MAIRTPSHLVAILETPVWFSPDGRKIAFVSGKSYGIFVMNADGTGLMQITHRALDVQPQFSPDGRGIVFKSFRDCPPGSGSGECGGIYVMSANGTGITRLTHSTLDQQGDDPDGFIVRDGVARFVEGYAAFIRAPVRCGARVTALRQKPGAERLLVESNDVTIDAANVVVATGPWQRPVIPRLAAAMLPWVFQIHSSGYRNPGQLPPGAVLVVGSGASGCQITEDLREGGRQVYLAVGYDRRSVRRYRGRDIVWWRVKMGL